jgi:hypothetical protein
VEYRTSINQEDVRDLKTPYAALARYAGQVSRNQGVAQDLKTLCAQIAQFVDLDNRKREAVQELRIRFVQTVQSAPQGIMLQDHVQDRITLFALDALLAVPLDK